MYPLKLIYSIIVHNNMKLGVIKL